MRLVPQAWTGPRFRGRMDTRTEPIPTRWWCQGAGREASAAEDCRDAARGDRSASAQQGRQETAQFGGSRT
eukprot:3696118-Alexandrium_andersonii.AAC.1